MQLLTLGISHKTASVSEREVIAGAWRDVLSVADALSQECGIQESAVLSTCHRTELYVATPCSHAVAAWFQRQKCAHSISKQAIYMHHDVRMVEHLISVASGLDSMILGESHIFSQMKQAYDFAMKSGMTGYYFNRLFPAVFGAAKHVRSETEIERHSLGLAPCVIQLMRNEHHCAAHSKILLLGAGEITELLLSYLHAHSIGQLVVMNRTFAKAHDLACRYGATPIDIAQLEHSLGQADIVISAAQSSVPLITSEMMRRVQNNTGSQTLFIDLSVPRNIEPTVSELPHVRLFHLDQLKTIASASNDVKRSAIDSARMLIEMQAAHCMRSMRLADTKETISQFRNNMEAIRDQTVSQAVRAVRNGKDPEKIIEQLGHRLTNQLIHQPTHYLRHAAYFQKESMLHLFKLLYKL